MYWKYLNRYLNTIDEFCTTSVNVAFLRIVRVERIRYKIVADFYDEIELGFIWYIRKCAPVPFFYRATPRLLYSIIVFRGIFYTQKTYNLLFIDASLYSYLPCILRFSFLTLFATAITCSTFSLILLHVSFLSAIVLVAGKDSQSSRVCWIFRGQGRTLFHFMDVQGCSQRRLSAE